MASNIQKGVSGAAGGAGLGMSFGGPVGAGIGAGLGLLGGFLGGSDSDITAPSFADINLAKENPDLFARLQQQESFVNEAKKLYDKRRQGMTPLEDQQMQNQLKDVGRQTALGGIAGGSEAYAISANAQRDAQNNIANRIYNEQNGLFQQYGQAQNGLYNNTRSALGDVMGQRMSQLGIQENNLSNSNQMWGGLVNGGLSALGSGYNSYKMAQMPTYNQNPMQSLPAGASMGAPGQGLQYSGPMSPAWSGPQPSYGVPGNYGMIGSMYGGQ